MGSSPHQRNADHTSSPRDQVPRTRVVRLAHIHTAGCEVSSGAGYNATRGLHSFRHSVGAVVSHHGVRSLTPGLALRTHNRSQLTSV